MRSSEVYEGGKKEKEEASSSLVQIFSWKQRIDSAIFGNRIKHTKPCIDKNM